MDTSDEKINTVEENAVVNSDAEKDVEQSRFSTFLDFVIYSLPNRLIDVFQVFLILAKLFNWFGIGFMPWWQIFLPTIMVFVFCFIWPPELDDLDIEQK